MQLLIMVSMIIFLSISSFLATNVYGVEKITNIYFSIEIPNNWIYHKSSDSPTSSLLGIGSSNVIALAPPQFGNFSVTNNSRDFMQNMQIAGAICIFSQELYNSTDNPKLEDYVRIKTLSQNDLNIISQEETTVGDERAVRIYADGIGKFANFKYIEYLIVHDKKPYYISYTARLAEYYTYLSEFDQVIKSFTFKD